MEWIKVSKKNPPFGERVIVFNTKRNKYEILELNWEDSKDIIWWVRQGGSILNIHVHRLCTPSMV